jgi:hypothetical protein
MAFLFQAVIDVIQKVFIGTPTDLSDVSSYIYRDDSTKIIYHVFECCIHPWTSICDSNECMRMSYTLHKNTDDAANEV